MPAETWTDAKCLDQESSPWYNLTLHSIIGAANTELVCDDEAHDRSQEDLTCGVEKALMINVIRSPYNKEKELVEELESFLIQYDQFSSILTPQAIEPLRMQLHRVGTLVEEVAVLNKLDKNALQILHSIKLISEESIRYLDELKIQESFDFAAEYAINKVLATVQTEIESYLVMRTDYRGLENNRSEVC